MTHSYHFTLKAMAVGLAVLHTYFAFIMWAIAEEYHLVSLRGIFITVALSLGCFLTLVALFGIFRAWRTKTLILLVTCILLLWPITTIGWDTISYYDARYCISVAC